MQIQNLAFLSGLFAVTIWGITPVLTKICVVNHNPLDFMAIRFGLSSLLLLIPIFANLGKWKNPFSMDLLKYGLLSFLFLFSQIYALKNLPSSWTVITMALSPLLTLVGIKNQFRESFAYAFLALFGTAICLVPDLTVLKLEFSSVIALAASPILWAFLTNFVRLLQNKHTDLQILASANIVTFLLSFPFLLTRIEKIETPNFQELFFLIFLSVALPSGIWLFNFTLRHRPIFGILSQYLKLVLGLLFSALLYDEKYTGWSALGSFLIVLSLFLSTSKMERAK